MKEHASGLITLAALAMVLIVVVILELHGNKDGGTIGELVAGAVGIAGAIAGRPQTTPTPPPGSSTTLVQKVAPVEAQPAAQEGAKL